MEATGTVVGVVSLGIILCDGIIQYCRDWKHQDDDVQALRDLTNGLKDILQEVERRLQRLPNLDPARVSSINNSLQACSDQILKAKGISDKYATGQTAGKKGKMKDIIQRLKFPLERKVLGELRDIMNAFRGNVDTALNLLNIDLTASVLEDIQSLQNNGKKEHQEIISQIQNSANNQDRNISAHVHSLTTSIDRSFSSLANKICESSADIISQVQARPTELVMSNRDQQKHFEKIASELHSLHQFQERVLLGAEHLSSPSLSFSNSRKKKRNFFECASTGSSYCTCTANAGIGSLSLSSHLKLWLRNPKWGFYKETETSIIHDRHCPIWYSSRKNTMYRFHSRAFGWRMSGSLEIRRSPSSGWSISPSLNFRPVVSYSSPTFRVISHYFDLSRRNEPESTTNCLRDLQTVFRSGRGSPRDVSDEGQSFLAFACWKLAEGYPSQLWQFVRGLLAMGIDIDEETEGQSLTNSIHEATFITPDYIWHLQIMQVWQRNFDFLLWCIQRGCELTSNSAKSLPDLSNGRAHVTGKPLFGIRMTVEKLRAYEDFAAAASCGALSLAVLRRDLPGTRAILEQQPYLLEQERNIFGQTPLFLAVGWPNGLEMLLQAATKKESILHDSSMPRPIITSLDYAIALGCAESMKLLATAGLAFGFEWSHYVASTVLEPAISDSLLHLIMERCRELHEIGLKALPKKLIQFLQVGNFEFFISKAWLIFNYFRWNNIIIPVKFKNVECCRDFCPHFGSIFHQKNLSPTTAQAFLNEGFKNIDIECEGLTPLMYLHIPSTVGVYEQYERFFKFVGFLVENGARLDKEIPPRYIAGLDLANSETRNHYQVIHRVASLSSCCFIFLRCHGVSGIPIISKLISSEAWKSLLTSVKSDPCLCACSSDGCRPISLALRFHARTWEPGGFLWDRIEVLNLLTNLATLLKNLTGEYLTRDVVRLVTFSALELTHTCCKHNMSFSMRDLKHKSEKILNSWSIDDSELDDSIDDSPDPVMIQLMHPTEIEEIRREEASMIDKLDLLVEEFMKEIDELAIPLSEFLRTRWRERMRAVLSEKDEMSEMERRAIVDLGVEILKDDEDKPEVDYDELHRTRMNKYDELRRTHQANYDNWIRGLEKSIK